MSDAFQAEAPPAVEFSPEWGGNAPRGGKTVVTRALKDGATVPLFLGQTLIRSLRDLGYNSTTSALCEHVDNAIQWGAKEVRVYFRQSGKQPNQKIDILVYDDGKGMAPHVLKVAMAFGGSMVYDNRAGIGRYGMGMKAAALNISRSFDVISWQEPNAFYSMTLDVEKIGQDRTNMIELPDPEIADELPTEVASMFIKPIDGTKKSIEAQDMLATDLNSLADRLGKSGTIVYLSNCDRLTYSTAKTLADHAIKDMGRIYRRQIEKGIKLYVNNCLVEAFDPTYWMDSARHTKVENLVEKKSSLVDSWTVNLPMAEDSKTTTPVRIRIFMLPVHSWAALPRTTVRNALHVFDNHAVSYMRNSREVDIGSEPRLKISKHHTNAWLRVEIEFTGDADEPFGVAANKQGVRLQQFAVEAILDYDNKRFTRTITDVRKTIREQYLKVTAEKLAGQTSAAEQHATSSDNLQAVVLPTPPVDTPEQEAALEANLRGLAAGLRREGETEDQAFDRVKASKFLTDFKHQEYGPFYDSEYKFGKLIVRVNTAHPFYREVWQPIADLARKSIPTAEIEDGDAITGDVADASRKALLGLELMLLSLARAQTQMTIGNTNEQLLNQVFRTLRKSWSDVLETQFLNV